MINAENRRPLVSAAATFLIVGAVGLSLAARATELERTRSRSEAETAASGVLDRLTREWNRLGVEALRLSTHPWFEDAGATAPGRPPGLVDIALSAYLLDGAGRVLSPDEPDMVVVPSGEWTRVEGMASSETVLALGPFAVGHDPGRLLAVAPVSGSGAGRARYWVGVSVAVDSLVARAGFDALGVAGYYHRLEQSHGGIPRLLDETAVRALRDPVAVQRTGLGAEFSVLVSPAGGWWSPGLRPGMLLLVLLLATLGAAFVHELARGPQRAQKSAERLSVRLREVQHLLKAESRKRERAEIRIRKGVASDPLTGLPSRDRLVRGLNRALRGVRADPEGARAAVLAIHVDRLTEVADSLGEDAADELLSRVAERLTEALRPGDVVARLSGGRFAALLSDMRGKEAPGEAAERVGDALDRPVRVRRHEVYTSVSIGMTAVVSGMETAEDLLREAETALHEARRLGRGRLVSYDSSLREVAAQSLLLRSDLRPALEEGQFLLAYQPIVSLAPGHALLGMEVLARWNHPREGMITPGLFIPIAEEDGFVVRLSRWISQRAARRYNAWKAAGLLPEGFYLSVNISGRELHQPDLVEYYERLIDEHALPPGGLRLEVTERMLTDDVELAARNLERLRDVGVQLMLDDFGTGYSSLSYLYQFRFDTMKIDRSFVMRVLESERERGTLQAIVQLAVSLDMKTVAEGIEDEEIVPILHGIGCSAGQGYLFARPLLGDDADAYLARDSERARSGLVARSPATSGKGAL